MELKAESRTAGQSRSLRSTGRLPGVMYNKELNVLVSVDLHTFDRVIRTQGTSSLIDLNIEGETHAVLVKAVQMDKRRRQPLHVDFFAVTAGQPVDVSVPLDYIGNSLGVQEGGQLDIKRRELQISVLPRLIPSSLAVDISELTIGDSLHVRDLPDSLLPEGAKTLDDGDLTLITVVPPRTVEEPSEFDEVEPEVITQSVEDEEKPEAEGGREDEG